MECGLTINKNYSTYWFRSSPHACSGHGLHKCIPHSRHTCMKWNACSIFPVSLGRELKHNVRLENSEGVRRPRRGCPSLELHPTLCCLAVGLLFHSCLDHQSFHITAPTEPEASKHPTKKSEHVNMQRVMKSRTFQRKLSSEVKCVISQC